jgi:hypothetical protein
MSGWSDKRKARMAALADAHDEWVGEKLAAGKVPFKPQGRKPGSDYNQHNVDLEADDDAFHAKAKRILGLTK